jgi:hypothetical protein
VSEQLLETRACQWVQCKTVGHEQEASEGCKVLDMVSAVLAISRWVWHSAMPCLFS